MPTCRSGSDIEYDADGLDVFTEARSLLGIDDEAMCEARREAFATVAALGGKA